jgi:hypothetical protein
MREQGGHGQKASRKDSRFSQGNVRLWQMAAARFTLGYWDVTKNARKRMRIIAL